MTTAVVPAAGLGSRLGSARPKALVELAGRPMLAHVLDALAPAVSRLVLVVRPGAEELFATAALRAGWPGPLDLVTQAEATGSADAVAVGLSVVEDDEPCVVVWADQVRVSRETVAEVARRLDGGRRSLVLPLVAVPDPYVWFETDGDLLRVFRQRDGDVAPQRGLSDVGTFGFRAADGRAVLGADQPVGPAGRERDFVYALPLLARSHGLTVIEIDRPEEALGVNSPDELVSAERALAGGHR